MIHATTAGRQPWSGVGQDTPRPVVRQDGRNTGVSGTLPSLTHPTTVGRQPWRGVGQDTPRPVVRQDARSTGASGIPLPLTHTITARGTITDGGGERAQAYRQTRPVVNTGLLAYRWPLLLPISPNGLCQGRVPRGRDLSASPQASRQRPSGELEQNGLVNYNANEALHSPGRGGASH